MPTREPLELITDREAGKLMQALVRGRGEIHEAYADIVLHWAAEARMRAMLLDLALKGKIVLIVKDGEVYVKDNGL